MAASRQGQRCGCYGFLCDALVHGQARTEMERNRAQAPRRGTYLSDQRGSRFSRNAWARAGEMSRAPFRKPIFCTILENVGGCKQN
jgi:hypothetical protein